MWFIDHIPTDSELSELNADAYIEYIEDILITKERIRAQLISLSDIESIDLQWVSFSDKEIWDIIIDRVFWGNPHAQTALIAKVINIITKQIQSKPLSYEDALLLEKSSSILWDINSVREKLSIKKI